MPCVNRTWQNTLIFRLKLFTDRLAQSDGFLRYFGNVSSLESPGFPKLTAEEYMQFLAWLPAILQTRVGELNVETVEVSR